MSLSGVFCSSQALGFWHEESRVRFFWSLSVFSRPLERLWVRPSPFAGAFLTLRNPSCGPQRFLFFCSFLRFLWCADASPIFSLFCCFFPEFFSPESSGPPSPAADLLLPPLRASGSFPAFPTFPLFLFFTFLPTWALSPYSNVFSCFFPPSFSRC